MNPQIKNKHHYIPKFHLKNWQDKSGQLLVYKKIGDGSIQSKGKHPSQVCFENGLYSLGKDLLGAQTLAPDYVENELSKIDNDAAKVMEKILSNSSLSLLTDEDKKSLAIYVCSLMNRNPDRIKANDELMRRIVKEIFDEIKAKGTEEVHETYEQCSNILKDSNYGENQVRLTLLSSSKDSETVHALSSFSWQLINIGNKFPYRFILTENPVVTFGEDDNIATVVIALSPTLLWIAVPKNFVNSAEFVDIAKNIVLIYNCAQIIKKPQFIISAVVLKNDGLHRYDRIFSEFVKITVGPNAKT